MQTPERLDARIRDLFKRVINAPSNPPVADFIAEGYIEHWHEMDTAALTDQLTR